MLCDLIDEQYNLTHSVRGRIKHLRSLMLVHSYMYYYIDNPIVTDDQWQQWANELRDVQSVFIHNINWYDEVFADWDGSTGYHLPVDDFVMTVVQRLRSLPMNPPTESTL